MKHQLFDGENESKNSDVKILCKDNTGIPPGPK